MRFLSVCSGIEAASVAWHPLGWEAVAFSEIEAFPSAVLETRWPGVPNLGDMTCIEGEKYRGAVELIIGGTPCQDFSIAGKRAGLSGERSGLALHFARLVRDIQPRWIVWENVPGAFSTNGGRDFGAFAGALAELGYGLAWRVLDAQYWGVPQRRRRIFLVGYLGDVRPAGAVLFERESLRRHTPPRGEKRKDVAGTLASRTQGGGGLGIDFEVAGGLQVTARCLSTSNQRLDCETETFVVAPVTTTPYADNVAQESRLVCSQFGNKAGALLARHDSSPCADRGMTVVAFQQNQLGEIRTGDVVGTLNTNSNASGRNTPMICGTLAASGAGTSRPAGQGNELGFLVPISFHASQDPCVSGDVTHPLGRNNGLECGICQQMRVRRLTPRECERLQGFPDDYTLIEYRGKPAADGPRYKALGNSMAVPVVRWLGERIAKVDAIFEGEKK